MHTFRSALVMHMSYPLSSITSLGIAYLQWVAEVSHFAFVTAGSGASNWGTFTMLFQDDCGGLLVIVLALWVYPSLTFSRLRSRTTKVSMTNINGKLSILTTFQQQRAPRAASFSKILKHSTSG